MDKLLFTGYNKSMDILAEAQKLTNADRQNVYGHPADDFAKVSAMVGPILASNIDPRLKHALYMIQVKVARLLNTPGHIDSIVDIAGYANTYSMVLAKIKENLEKQNEPTQTTEQRLLRGSSKITKFS